MRRFIAFIILLFLCSFVYSPIYARQVRKPAASGTFYPKDKQILSAQIDKYLNKIKPQQVKGKLLGLILPHAGYVYSGQVAAYGYKLLENRNYDTVIIIGPSHRVRFNGISLYNGDFYRTPLGDVAIDKEISSSLIDRLKFASFYELAHKGEHSVEVQVPFLQKTLSNFKIVPIVTGNISYNQAKNFASSLSKVIKKQDKRILIIASTDLSHYYDYDTALDLDYETIKTIKTLAPELLIKKYSNKEIELCGFMPVLITEITSRHLGANKVKFLKYANSGDVTFTKNRVVGYASIAILIDEGGKKDMLSNNQKIRLIKIARESIESFLKEKKKLSLDVDDEELKREMGAFVTIHKGGELRGCIGNIIGRGPLYLTVRDMAIASATDDPRFPPLSPDELDEIDIEISVLSEPKRITDVEEIQMGVHGVIVKRGSQSGIYLPQVATETGWGKEEFLSSLCAHKAGLSPDAWKDKQTDIYIFTAEVFSEKELKE